MDKVLAATRGIKIERTPQLTSGVQVKVGRLPKQVWKSIVSHATNTPTRPFHAYQGGVQISHQTFQRGKQNSH